MSWSQHLQPVKLQSQDYFSLPSCISRHLSFVPPAKDEWMSKRGRESPSLLKYIHPQLRLGITNDIMAICHASQFSDVLPTHLLWYLVTDPAANQSLVMGMGQTPLCGYPMTWKAIGDASAWSMCCTDRAAGLCQKASHTNFPDHSVFNRWVSSHEARLRICE